MSAGKISPLIAQGNAFFNIMVRIGIQSIIKLIIKLAEGCTPEQISQ